MKKVSLAAARLLVGLAARAAPEAPAIQLGPPFSHGAAPGEKTTESTGYRPPFNRVQWPIQQGTVVGAVA